jgi:hypothetical protein
MSVFRSSRAKVSGGQFLVNHRKQVVATVVMLEKKTPRQMNEISAERSHCSARARHLCHKLGLNGES